MLLLRHPKTESRLQQRHELVSNCCRKQKTGLFRIIRVLQISCYSSVAMGYCTWKEKHVRGKNIINERANFLFVLSIFTSHGACLSFWHHKERFYSILVLLFSKPSAEHFASSFHPQIFRTDIIHIPKRFSETSEKSLVPLAVMFLGTDHLAVLHSSLSLLS